MPYPIKPPLTPLCASPRDVLGACPHLPFAPMVRLPLAGGLSPNPGPSPAQPQPSPSPCQAPVNPTDVEAAQRLIPCPDPEAAPLPPLGYLGTRSSNGELHGRCPLLGFESSLRTSQALPSSRNIKGIATGGQEAAPHVTGTPSTVGRRGKVRA